MRRRSTYAAIAVVIVLVGLAVAWNRTQDLPRTEVAWGIVMDVAMAGGRSTQRRCYLKVEFADSRGIRYIHWSEDSFPFSEYGFGSQILVHYNKDNPAFCSVGE